MSEIKKLHNISSSHIAARGVAALSDRPNYTSKYGESGMTPAQLKSHFDNTAHYLAEQINKIIDLLPSDDAASYIRICMDDLGIANLADLIVSIQSGAFGEAVLKVFPSASAEERVSLQAAVFDIAKDISTLLESDEDQDERIGDLEAFSVADITMEIVEENLVVKGYNSKNELLFSRKVPFDGGLSGAGLAVVDGALCVMIEE